MIDGSFNMASMLLSSGTRAISSGFAIIFLFVPDLMQTW